jgi:hypothetical protein
VLRCATLCAVLCRGKPKIVDLTSKRRLADKVTEAYIACGEAERDESLYCLLAKHPGELCCCAVLLRWNRVA